MGAKDFSLAEGGTPRDAMLLPVGKAAMLTPSFNTSPHVVVVPAMPISKIPAAMRKMGWNVSAALMDRWFSSAGWQMKPEMKNDKTAPSARSLSDQVVDEKTVTMAWALGFDRCARVLRVLQGRWGVPAAADILLRRLRRAGWDGQARCALGTRRMSARELEDTCSINYLTVGHSTDVLDDFYGALGSATMKLAFAGTTFTSATTGKRGFCISAIGMYLKDHYDFNEHQYLGLWTEDGVAGKVGTLRAVAMEFTTALVASDTVYKWQSSGVGHVYNESFQAYRQRFGRGGDFFIYSDVLWAEVDLYVDLEDAIQRAAKPL